MSFGLENARIFSFDQSIIQSGYREEHFLEISSGEIRMDLTVNDCSKKQYMEVVIFKESDRMNIFPKTNNYQPVCCKEKSTDNCQHGLIITNPNTINYIHYLIEPTCTQSNYTIPKYLKKRQGYHFKNTTLFPLYNINHSFNIQYSTVYSVLVANCSPDNISISGDIKLYQNKATRHYLDHLLYRFNNQTLCCIIITVLSLIFYGVLFTKNNPNLSSFHKIWIWSLVFCILNQLLKFCYFLIWDNINKKLGILVLLYSVFSGFSFSSMLFLIYNVLEFEHYKHVFYIIISFFLTFGYTYESYTFINCYTGEQLHWFLGYGKFPILFIVILSSFFSYIISYSKINLSEGFHANFNSEKKKLFVNILYIGYIFYFLLTFGFSIYLLDLPFIRVRSIFSYGTLFDQILYMILSHLCGWFIYKHNNEGWAQLNDNESDEPQMSLVGNGEPKKFKASKIIFTNSDHDDLNDVSLQELQPIETS